MQTKLLFRSCALLAVIELMVGCAASTAPSGWLPSAPDTQWDGYGSWATVTLSIGPEEWIEGELIAATADTLHILQTGRLESFGYDQIAKIQLQSYDSEYGALAVWTVLGSVSTISHGFILILTAPVWIITGSIAASAQSRASLETVVGAEWRQLLPYCRYPGGIPDSIDRTTIKPKQAKFPI